MLRIRATNGLELVGFNPMKKLLFLTLLGCGACSLRAATVTLESLDPNSFATNGTPPHTVSARFTNSIPQFNGTNVATINPTIGRVPYNGDGTNLFDSWWIYTPNGMQTDTNIFFGTTNVLIHSGADMILTNGATATKFGVQNGSGGMVSIGTDGGGVPTLESSTATLYFKQIGGASALHLNNGSFGPNTSGVLDNGQEFDAWKDGWYDGMLNVEGYYTSPADYSRLSIYHTGTNGDAIFDSQSGGIAGLPRSFVFTNGVLHADSTKGIELGGVTNMTWPSGGGISGLTAGYVPYALNSTMLGDSGLFWDGDHYSMSNSLGKKSFRLNTNTGAIYAYGYTAGNPGRFAGFDSDTNEVDLYPGKLYHTSKTSGVQPFYFTANSVTNFWRFLWNGLSGASVTNSPFTVWSNAVQMAAGNKFYFGTNYMEVSTGTPTMNGAAWPGGGAPTYAQVTNAVLATGSASDIWHGDGSWSPGGSGGETNWTQAAGVITAGTNVVEVPIASNGEAVLSVGLSGDAIVRSSVATNYPVAALEVTDGVDSVLIVADWTFSDTGTGVFINGVPIGGSGGGNMTNTGASVVGMIPVYTDTTGTQVTPTNGIPELYVEHLHSTNTAFANTVPVFDNSSPPEMVPSSMTTNVLALLMSQSGNITNWGKITTNSMAALASPALTGTPTINSQSIETQLTNKVEKAGDVITGNLGAQLAVGDTGYFDITYASRTNSVTGAMTFLYCTNGTDLVDRTIVRWFFNGSGSDQTVAFPVTGGTGWRTNTYSSVPPAFTNGTITKVVLNVGGPTNTAEKQTNCYVSFEYYK